MRKVSIEVTHIGEDYGKVEVTDVDNTTQEFELPLSFVLSLDLFLDNLKEAK